jgi:hypothetical protein
MQRFNYHGRFYTTISDSTEKQKEFQTQGNNQRKERRFTASSNPSPQYKTLPLPDK